VRIGVRARMLISAAAGAGVAAAGYTALGGGASPQGGVATSRSAPESAVRIGADTPGTGGVSAPLAADPAEDLGPPRGATPPSTPAGTDLPSFPLPGFVPAAAPAIAAPAPSAVPPAPGQPPQVPSFSPPLPTSSSPALPGFPTFSSSLAFSSFPVGSPFPSFPLNNPFSTFPLSGFLSSLGSGSSIFPNLPLGGTLTGLGGGLFPLGGSGGGLGLGGGLLPGFPLGAGLSPLGQGAPPAGLTLSIGRTFPPGTTIPVPPDTKPTGTSISVGVTVPIGSGLGGPLPVPVPFPVGSVIDPLLGLDLGPLGDPRLLSELGLGDLGFGDLGLDRHLFRHLSFDGDSLFGERRHHH